MNKRTVEKLQAIVFIVALAIAFILNRFFAVDEVIILYVAGAYWGFVILVHIIYGIFQRKRKKAIIETMPEKHQKKEKSKTLDKWEDFIMYVIAVVIAFPIWIALASRICPLDNQRIEALDCIDPGISLIATVIGLIIIEFFLGSLFDTLKDYLIGGAEDEELPPDTADLLVNVAAHLIYIIVIAGIVLLVYFGTLNWGKILSEDSLTVKRLWYEKTYALESMEYYTYDANNGILTIDFDNKTFSLAMDDFMDHTTKAFDKQYEELSDFGEYLFCKKYTYISHKLI